VDLHFQLRDEGCYRVLYVSGELDLTTAPALRSRLIELIRGSAAALLVDLGGVTFCDSSGLSAAVAAERAAATQRTPLAFVAANETVAKLFRITNLDQCLRIYGDLPAAVADLPRRTPA
jgi:anti-sigma B factor antagonist